MESVPSLHILAPSSGPSSEGGRGPNAGERLRLLGAVEDVLRRVLGLEARLWLCSALQALSIPHKVYGAVFLELFRRAAESVQGSPSERGARDEEAVVKQVLRMLCESRPRQVARLLINDSAMLRHFLSGQSKRVRQWFQNFAAVGAADHQFGARALARYAFTHRETSWHELVWKGNHSQAPATVAAKPHYFAELDVNETIDNFLDRLPEFWSSEELKDSLEDGAFLALDVDFFIEELFEKMKDDDSSNIWRLLKVCLGEESFAVLCKRILPVAMDQRFLEFVNGLAAAMARLRKGRLSDRDREERIESTGLASSSLENRWLEISLSVGVEWRTLNDVIFCNACVGHGRELVRLLKDEEQGEGEQLESLLSSKDPYCEQEHWKLRDECLLVPKWKALTWLAVEAWLLFYLLSRDSTSPTALEMLLTEIGVGFVRTGGAGLSKDAEDEPDSRGHTESTTRKRKRRSRKKHRWKLREKSSKKHNLSDDEYNSESDSDLPFATDSFSSPALSWRLSTDDYVMTWTKVDVCEHLVYYSLRRWLQWTVLRW